MSTHTRALATFATVAAGAAVALTGVGSAQAADGQGKPGHLSFAVLGDVPYGDAQLQAFPGWLDQINAADPAFTLHLGDIKSGSTRCDTSYYELIKADVDRLDAPLYYAPGDNEWTDCHRASNGSYNPLERLSVLREIFFGTSEGFPENVSFRAQRVDLAVVHVVGSNDDLAPWSGLGLAEATAAQVAEERARRADVIATIGEAFASARQRHDRAVVVAMQADMFDPSYVPNFETDISAFQPIVQALVDEARSFDGEVYLLNGDSHTFHVDQPLAAGSPWLQIYDVSGSADNLTRVTVDGSSNNVDWLQITVNRPGAEHALSWRQVPYTS